MRMKDSTICATVGSRKSPASRLTEDAPDIAGDNVTRSISD